MLDAILIAWLGCYRILKFCDSEEVRREVERTISTNEQGMKYNDSVECASIANMVLRCSPMVV